jgi:hypothetical protein
MDVYPTQKGLAFLTGVISHLITNPVALTCKNDPTFRHCVLDHAWFGRRERDASRANSLVMHQGHQSHHVSYLSQIMLLEHC